MAQTFEDYAAGIRKEWKAAGRPPCNHSRTEKDRFSGMGMDSGDRVCLGCGATWYLDNRPSPWTGSE